jgi:uncharacterized protein (DUF4415 family)
MKKKSSSTTSKTDWKRVGATSSKRIKLTAEHPEAKLDHIVRGIARRGLRSAAPKTSVSLRLDTDVLSWFKAQGSGYQTRVNAVLRAFRDASI